MRGDHAVAPAFGGRYTITCYEDAQHQSASCAMCHRCCVPVEPSHPGHMAPGVAQHDDLPCLVYWFDAFRLKTQRVSSEITPSRAPSARCAINQSCCPGAASSWLQVLAAKPSQNFGSEALARSLFRLRFSVRWPSSASGHLPV